MRPLLLALILALPAAAQEAAGTPVLEVVDQGLGQDTGGYAIEVKLRGAPKGPDVTWRLSPEPPGLYYRKIYASRSAVFATLPGTYTVTAEYTVSRVGKLEKPLSEYKEGDIWPRVDETVTLTKTVKLIGPPPGPVPPGPGPAPIPPGPGPGPGPLPPVPPPPAPVDPLVAALKAAAAADGWPAAKLAALASAFKAAADVTVAGRTAGELQQARKRVLAQSLPEGVPANLAAVITPVQRQVDTFLPPSDPTHVVTADEARRVKDIYAALAAACEAVR